MAILAFIVSFVLFVAGFFIMGYAEYIDGLETPVFIAGIFTSSLGLFIPVHVMKRIDG